MRLVDSLAMMQDGSRSLPEPGPITPEMTRRQIEHRREVDEKSRQTLNLATLLSRVQAVATAERSDADPRALHAALVDVAAVAESWAASLDDRRRRGVRSPTS